MTRTAAVSDKRATCSAWSSPATFPGSPQQQPRQTTILHGAGFLMRT
ncbi:hypothetical protein ACFQX6_17530 [Streptosporangium lutulentum]